MNIQTPEPSVCYAAAKASSRHTVRVILEALVIAAPDTKGMADLIASIECCQNDVEDTMIAGEYLVEEAAKYRDVKIAEHNYQFEDLCACHVFQLYLYNRQH